MNLRKHRDDYSVPAGYVLRPAGEMMERTDIQWSDRWHSLGQSALLSAVDPSCRVARRMTEGEWYEASKANQEFVRWLDGAKEEIDMMYQSEIAGLFRAWVDGRAVGYENGFNDGLPPHA